MKVQMKHIFHDNKLKQERF